MTITWPLAFILLSFAFLACPYSCDGLDQKGGGDLALGDDFRQTLVTLLVLLCSNFVQAAVSWR